MNITLRDVVSKKIITREGELIGVINDVVVHVCSSSYVFFLVDIDHKWALDSKSVVIPMDALIIKDNGEMQFPLPARLLKACKFYGDGRALQEQNDIFFTRLIRAFEFWRSSVDYFGNQDDVSKLIKGAQSGNNKMSLTSEASLTQNIKMQSSLKSVV